MQVEFVGQSARVGDNRAANTSRLVNCYRVRIDGSETDRYLESVLGQAAFADLGTIWTRAFKKVGDTFYAVADGSLYAIDADGVVSSLGAVVNAEDATISGNLDNVAVASGGTYYVWDGAALTSPATGNFADIGSVDYLGGYTVYTQRGGRRWGWSDPLDAKTLPALNFATAEAKDDDCLRVLAVQGNAWIFKETSIEIWYLTGQAGADAFVRMAGGVIDTGLKAFGLVTLLDNGAFFIGDDNVAYVTTGAGLTPVSVNVPGPTYSIVNEKPQECHYHEDGDHKFCAITFLNRPAWVFDMVTGEWHERAEGENDPWTASGTAESSGTWYSAHKGGKINRMVRSNADVGQALQRRAVSKTLGGDGNRFRVAELEFFGRMGFTSLGRAARAWLKVSGDRGMTWSNERLLSFGEIGEYQNRANLRALGQFRQFTAELNISDPDEISVNTIARVRIA